CGRRPGGGPGGPAPPPPPRGGGGGGAQHPNAGVVPSEYGDGGYQLPHYWLDGKIERDNYREHPWVEGHLPNHIGGTMRPVQGVPEMSPFYVEFEEYLGGYNFGGGNAQLDFRDMRFDWACG
ncbi:hypothetical protein OFL47_24995, partial [Pseudomonas aeruginosa]|nr:hypothetical protein [Pseudomonas aeruginosa]